MRNACFEPPTCLVSFLWFCCGVAVPVGQAAVSEEVAGSFCVPGVTVRDIPTCFIKCEKSFCIVFRG